MPQLYLLNGSSIDGGMFDHTAKALEREFGVTVQKRSYAFRLPSAFDKPRGQYLSSGLLRSMLGDASLADSQKMLGIVDVDLYAPVLTFVFGEAQLGGTSGILSTFRLHNDFYGLPEDLELLRTRVVKEAVHETGHLFGLVHCHSFECVMRSSTYVEEIDLKTPSLCTSCRAKLPR